MADGQQWVGTVAPAVIALAGTALIQIGSWPARARRAIRSDLEIVNDLPDGPERVALTDSILRRTQNLVIRANQPRFVDSLVLTTRRVVLTLMFLFSALVALSLLANYAVNASGRAAESVNMGTSQSQLDAVLKTIARAPGCSHPRLDRDCDGDCAGCRPDTSRSPFRTDDLAA